MPRTMLTDQTWKKLKDVLKESGRVYNKCEYRNTLEGILYRMRTGIQWRDSPPEFGLWNTIFRRFNFWSKKGVLEKLLHCLAKESDTDGCSSMAVLSRHIRIVREADIKMTKP